MDKVSVLIPGRNDACLTRTVEDVYCKATGEIEVVIVLDGPTQFPLPKPRKNMIIREFATPGGIRFATNRAEEVATGKYIMRLDSHCAVCEGFDEILKSDCDGDWIVSPRYYELAEGTWDKRGGYMDYFYPGCPWTERIPFRSRTWFGFTRTIERINVAIDDQMISHGSAWLMPTAYWQRLGGMDERRDGRSLCYADHYALCYKAWLSGGRCMVNKKAWYAHRHPSLPKQFERNKQDITDDIIAETRYWVGNRWEGRIHDYEWLIDHFWPLPTPEKHHVFEHGLWPEDWKKYL